MTWLLNMGMKKSDFEIFKVGTDCDGNHRAYLELLEELKCITTFLSSRAQGSRKGQLGLLVLF